MFQGSRIPDASTIAFLPAQVQDPAHEGMAGYPPFEQEGFSAVIFPDPAGRLAHEMVHPGSGNSLKSPDPEMP